MLFIKNLLLLQNNENWLKIDWSWRQKKLQWRKTKKKIDEKFLPLILNSRQNGSSAIAYYKKYYPIYKNIVNKYRLLEAVFSVVYSAI